MKLYISVNQRILSLTDRVNYGMVERERLSVFNRVPSLVHLVLTSSPLLEGLDHGEVLL